MWIYIRVIFIYRHFMTFYYKKEHLLLPGHFLLVKVIFVLKKGKLDVGISVI